MWDGRLTKGTGFRLYSTYRDLNKISPKVENKEYHVDLSYI